MTVSSLPAYRGSVLRGGRSGRPSWRATVRSKQREPVLRGLDWVLAGAVLALALLGSVLIWSATREEMIFLGQDPESFLKRHLVNLTIGLVLAGFVLRLEPRRLRVYAPALYLLALAGLVAVLAIGTELNGAKAWIFLPGGLSLQVSEFAKIAIVAMLAVLLSRRGLGGSGPSAATIVATLGLAGVPTVLVLLQNDLGTVLVFAAIVFGMITTSGARAAWVIGLTVTAVAGVALVIASGALDDYQLRRLTSFVDPTADPRGAGYNSQQARIAIGSGGLLGSGLFQGPQTQGRFVPEQQTDFIFTVAGEELGLLGAGTILVLLGLVLWRALRIGMAAPDTFGRLVAAGVVSWFTFQSFQNIGMCLGIMPVTGLPLPFVSHGGSSMFASMIAVGLLQNMHRDLHREQRARAPRGARPSLTR